MSKLSEEEEEKRRLVEGSLPSGTTDADASVSKSIDEAGGNVTSRKPTVLESHGYALGRTIGAGSYATVKVARSDRHECQVAIKIVSKYQAPEDYLKKFLPREIEVVKGLKHPHLIRFLQAIETTHRVYIIMEYAVNGSLLNIICRETFIDESRSRRWFGQLVDAVDYCHERGVVHRVYRLGIIDKGLDEAARSNKHSYPLNDAKMIIRDIKCENLLMDRDNNLKLSDFGFARGQMKPKNGVAALSETFCGSYAYASPEILRGIPYQPQLSDIWSLGVVLFAMVYGCLPFDDANFAQLLKQVESKVTFPKVPKVSSECRSLISRILAPPRSRLRIANIRTDPWFVVPVSEAETSISAKSLENLHTGTKIAKELRILDPRGTVASPPALSGPEIMAIRETANVYPSTSHEPDPIATRSMEISSSRIDKNLSLSEMNDE